MKKIIFVDDLREIIEVQEKEMRKILAADKNDIVQVESILCDMIGVEDCLDACGNIQHEKQEAYDPIHQVLKNILNRINVATQEIHSPKDKVEVVIDLCLINKGEELDSYKSGAKLTKYILKNMNDRHYFEEQSFLITIVSNLASLDYSPFLSECLTEEEIGRVVQCPRPFRNINGKWKIDKTGTAFPEFYYEFKYDNDSEYPMINKLLLDKESVPGNTGTYYGNYYGIIYARLYKNEGDSVS